jgi:peroxiredoxin
MNPLCLLLMTLVAAPHLAQSESQTTDQLLTDTAKNYQALTSYELEGHAGVAIPGSVWQMNFSFAYIGPRQEPAPDGGPPKLVQGGGRVGRMKPLKTVADSPEPQPTDVGLPFALLNSFGTTIADAVVSVEHAGSETLQLNGEDVPCEILKVTYAPSTPEHPHPGAVTYSISPAKHLILKEVLTSRAGRHVENGLWTVVFDTAKFNRPPPQWLLDMAKIPKVRVRSEWIGKAAPEFSLPGSDGSPVKLSSLRGKAVLLDFWSTFCGPCKLEIPVLEEVGREYEGKGAVLLGISVDPTEKSKAWLDKNGRTLRTLTDSDYVASDAFKIHGIPALVLVGRDGKVKQYWEGSVEKEAVQAALKSALKRRPFSN